MTIYKMLIALALIAGMLMTSCNDYLDIKPKGDKIPETLADYEALLRGETMLNPIAYIPVLQALYLMNDAQRNKMMLNTKNLTTANYMWDESADRIALNSGSEQFLDFTYSGIACCNLILDGVPQVSGCDENERRELIAYARTIRAYNYLMLVNYYADTYSASTASATLGVPVILSSDPNAHHEQMTVGAIYDFIITEIKDALQNGLPDTAMTILHPSKGAAHAMLARAYLMMGRFDDALTEAEAALAANSALYDWNAFYDANAVNIEKPTSYALMQSPMGYDYCENYFFRHGDGPSSMGQCVPGGNTFAGPNMVLSRGEQFEDGDAKFMARWKKRTQGIDTFYYATLRGAQNMGGVTTVEMYLIKAECLARDGQTDDAMDIVNDIRKTRIRPDKYTDKSASSKAEAMEIIRALKDNELAMTLIPFMDARRFNAEGTYARIMTKTVDGVTYTLTSDSHLWTMVFPANAMKNCGNGSVQQNSK